MNAARLRSGLRNLLAGGLPRLRVIGLAYTGLGGIVALTLVVSAGLVMPGAPTVQQATEPARQAVSSVIQPAADAMLGVLGGSLTRVQPAAQPASARLPSPVNDQPMTLEVSFDDAPAAVSAAEPAPAPAWNQGLRPPVVARSAAPDVVQPAVAEMSDEAAADEPDVPSVDSKPEPEPEQPAIVVQSAAPPMLQAAAQDAPRALPPVPTPTETAVEGKARREAANQAAIDAARAASAKAKAGADATNDAAIAARKDKASGRAAAALTTTTASNPSTTPEPAQQAAATVATAEPTRAASIVTPAPSNPASALSRAAADVANQAAIQAAKLAQKQSREQSNVANQVAIDAAKAVRTPVQATAAPTARATTPSPAPTATTTPLSVSEAQPDAASDTLAEQHSADSTAPQIEETASLDDASAPPGAASDHA